MNIDDLWDEVCESMHLPSPVDTVLRRYLPKMSRERALALLGTADQPVFHQLISDEQPDDIVCNLAREGIRMELQRRHAQYWTSITLARYTHLVDNALDVLGYALYGYERSQMRPWFESRTDPTECAEQLLKRRRSR